MSQWDLCGTWALKVFRWQTSWNSILGRFYWWRMSEDMRWETERIIWAQYDLHLTKDCDGSKEEQEGKKIIIYEVIEFNQENQYVSVGKEVLVAKI